MSDSVIRVSNKTLTPEEVQERTRHTYFNGVSLFNLFEVLYWMKDAPFLLFVLHTEVENDERKKLRKVVKKMLL